MASPDLIRFAHSLADAARGETLSHEHGSSAVENKGGTAAFDPVTRADRDSERAMRALIERDYPEHGVAGEELGEKPGSSRYRWLLDPIDGTRSFTCGLPTWTTLIALLDEGEPVLGIIDAPALDERYAGHSRECWLSKGRARERLRVSDCTSLAEARLATTDPFLFDGHAAEAFSGLRESVATTRYSLDGYAFAQLAAGGIDVVIECGLKPHDYAALIPVVRGAGGVFGDWSGGSDFSAGNVIAAATPKLYEAVVAIIKGAGGGLAGLE